MQQKGYLCKVETESLTKPFQMLFVTMHCGYMYSDGLLLNIDLNESFEYQYGQITEDLAQVL